MRLGLALAAVLVSVSAVSAADVLPAATKLPYKAAVASPAYDWSGFYIGAMGGYGWSGDLKGGFAGGTVGGNAQFGNLVVGGEIEGAWSDLKVSAAVPAIAGSAYDKLKAFGSVTGRIGYAVNNVLFYGKGGFAAASNELGGTGFGVAISDSQTIYGYTVGAGIEYGFTPNWSAKAEYLYTHYQSSTYFGGTGVLPAFDVNSVKLGINYRFGWGGGAVVAKY